MKRSQGITQAFWESLSEDRKLAWKYTSRMIGLLLASLVTKTGNAYIDWVLPALTAIFFMIAIETQRSYSKLSPRLRKANVRVLVFMGSWGIALAGIVYFSQAAFIASVQVFFEQVRPALDRGRPAVPSYVMPILFALAAPVAIIRVLRQLGVEQLIYHLPRHGLKEFFIRRRFRVTSFAMFAHVELSLLMVCLIYASVVAELAKSLVLIVNVTNS